MPCLRLSYPHGATFCREEQGEGRGEGEEGQKRQKGRRMERGASTANLK